MPSNLCIFLLKIGQKILAKSFFFFKEKKPKGETNPGKAQGEGAGTFPCPCGTQMFRTHWQLLISRGCSTTQSRNPADFPGKLSQNDFWRSTQGFEGPQPCPTLHSCDSELQEITGELQNSGTLENSGIPQSLRETGIVVQGHSSCCALQGMGNSGASGLAPVPCPPAEPTQI